MEEAVSCEPRPVEYLDSSTLACLVDDYSATADSRGWNRFEAFAWEEIRAERLTADQRSAVAFMTYIEDHLPGYFAEYHRLFPVDETPAPAEFIHNRELYRFTVQWAHEEDRHAHTLFTYQVRSGLASAEELRRDLAVEGQKRFCLGQLEPVQAFTYTLVQEKATQLFYRQFASVVQEPVLRRILVHLARDESRHFAFFVKVVEAYLQQFGPAVIPAMKEVVRDFKMPLATTLRNYWRWALRIEQAWGYDHTAAYEELVRVVKRTADARENSRAHDLTQFVRAIREL
jgi:hypothetical protein